MRVLSCRNFVDNEAIVLSAPNNRSRVFKTVDILFDFLMNFLVVLPFLASFVIVVLLAKSKEFLLRLRQGASVIVL